MELDFHSNIQTVVSVIFIPSKRFHGKKNSLCTKMQQETGAPKTRIHLKEHAHYWLANKNCKVMQS
jgi:hypothetical protein